VLAAHRLGLNTLVVPKDNEKDLRDVPEEIREQLEIHLVATMDEVLALALVSPLSPLPAEDVLPPKASDDGLEPPLAH
jgi:ATP-dependent Lon protease